MTTSAAQPVPPNRPARLASPIENIRSRYDAVVIGSGYGGSIAASRLARAGQRVCLLERGREFQPGDYPDTTVEALAQFQLDGEHGHVGPKTGLFDFHANRELGVFQGCGLGGTSLVNASVVLPAEQRVLDDPVWPQALRDDAAVGMKAGLRPRGGDAQARAVPAGLPAAREARRPAGGRRPPRRALLPAADQRQLRGRRQPRRRVPAGLPPLRRLRQRLQLRGQEHADHELPARRPEPRRGDLHARAREPRRAAGRALARALPARRLRPGRLRRAAAPRGRRRRRARRGRPRLDRDPAPLARARPAALRRGSASASAATATSSPSATTSTAP